MLPQNPDARWHVTWLNPRMPWDKHAIRPAEVADGLCRVMTGRDNLLEDANYNKIVPNHYMVELSTQNYSRYYAPLENGLIQQWRDRLLEHLLTANSRLGRKEYRLTGHLQVDLRPASDLQDDQARILCCVEPELAAGENLARDNARGRGTEMAFLELVDGHRRWTLYAGDNTIGRDEACDIFLDIPLIQQIRLVSAQHAIIRMDGGQGILLDGSPSGKPSANGTYANSKRVPAHGVPLRDGDIIILAATDPAHPRLDTPGVAAFRFRKALLDAVQPDDLND